MTTDQQPTSLPPSGAALPTSVERTNLTASRTWALIDNQISPEELEKLSADLSQSPEARRAYMDSIRLHLDLQQILKGPIEN
jgi:hypothetical protein